MPCTVGDGEVFSFPFHVGFRVRPLKHVMHGAIFSTSGGRRRPYVGTDPLVSILEIILLKKMIRFLNVILCVIGSSY